MLQTILAFAEGSAKPTDAVYTKILEIFDLVVNYLILIIELVGIVVLIYAVASAAVR